MSSDVSTGQILKEIVGCVKEGSTGFRPHYVPRGRAGLILAVSFADYSEVFTLTEVVIV